MEKQIILQRLIDNVIGHAQSSADSRDPAYVLDLFTCLECADLRAKLERIEREEAK